MLLGAKLDESTKDIELNFLVNNVGTAWAGKLHEMPYQKIFDLLHVNCITPSYFTEYFF